MRADMVGKVSDRGGSVRDLGFLARDLDLIGEKSSPEHHADDDSGHGAEERVVTKSVVVGS
jgi:hypothetical protein